MPPVYVCMFPFLCFDHSTVLCTFFDIFSGSCRSVPGTCAPTPLDGCGRPPRLPRFYRPLMLLCAQPHAAPAPIFPNPPHLSILAASVWLADAAMQPQSVVVSLPHTLRRRPLFGPMWCVRRGKHLRRSCCGRPGRVFSELDATVGKQQRARCASDTFLFFRFSALSRHRM